MSALTLRYSQPTETESAEVLPARWSPMLATFVWSAVSAVVWTVVLGAGVALF